MPVEAKVSSVPATVVFRSSPLEEEASAEKSPSALMGAFCLSLIFTWAILSPVIQDTPTTIWFPLSASFLGIVTALEETFALVAAAAARDISPFEASSPATSTSALFFTFATPTAMIGMAVEVPSAFLPIVAAEIFTLTVASACKFASPPALTEPVSPRVTEAVLFLTAQSASQLKPKSLARFCPIWEIFQLFQLVLSNVVWASADRSTPPSDSILPLTSTVALFDVSKMALYVCPPGMIGVLVYSLAAVARRMMSPESSAAGFRVTEPTSKVAAVS